LNLAENKWLQINETDIISDSSGTATLSNIDAVDGTTIGTFNAALDFPSSASTSRAGIVELATTAETTTGTSTTLAVTPDGLKDGFEGSANIDTVGTIGSGTWQGTAIASAYLDADTAHYSATKQFTHHMFKDDIDTTKHYIGLQEADAEGTTAPSKNLPFTAGVAGKLLKIFLRATGDLSGQTLTWRLETVPTSQDTGHAPTVIGTQSGAGCTDQTMTTYDFTTSLDSGDNIIDVGDQVLLSIESSAGTANLIYYVTCLWEWDLG
jgi:hypothetical protein